MFDLISRIPVVLDWTNAIGKIPSAFGKLVECYKALPKPVKISLKSLGLSGVAYTLCTAPKNIGSHGYILFCETQFKKNNIDTQTTAWRRVRRGFFALIKDVDSLANSAVTTTGFLTTARLISEKFGCWIPVYGQISLALSVIPMALKVKSIGRSIRRIYTPPEPPPELKNQWDEAQKIKWKLGYNLADLALKVTAAVAVILAIMMPPTFVVGAVLSVSVAMLSLGLKIGEKVLKDRGLLKS